MLYLISPVGKNVVHDAQGKRSCEWILVSIFLFKLLICFIPGNETDEDQSFERGILLMNSSAALVLSSHHLGMSYKYTQVSGVFITLSWIIFMAVIKLNICGIFFWNE